MTERLKSYKLNIYKLSAPSFSLRALQPLEANPEYELEAEDHADDMKYKFFVQRNAVHPPSWFGLLRPLIDGSKPEFSQVFCCQRITSPPKKLRK